jgi:hypothetical protein
LSRERQDLYRELGECFGARREALQQRVVAPRPRKRRPPAAQAEPIASAPEREKEDA